MPRRDVTTERLAIVDFARPDAFEQAQRLFARNVKRARAANKEAFGEEVPRRSAEGAAGVGVGVLPAAVEA